MSIRRRIIALAFALGLLLTIALVALFFATGRLQDRAVGHAASDETVDNGFTALRAVVDMDARLHAYLVLDDRRFRTAWARSRADFERAVSPLAGRAVGDRDTTRVVRAIVRDGRAYLAYAEPLIAQRSADRFSASQARTSLDEAETRITSVRRHFGALGRIRVAHEKARLQSTTEAASWAGAISAIAMAGSLALVLLAGFVVRRDVLRPLAAVGATARRVGRGDLAARVPEPRLAEFDDLTRAFNGMAGQLAAQRAELLDSNAALERRVSERTADLEEARLELLQRLARATEYRDDDTRQHTDRVARTSALIAQALELPSNEVELLRLAAPLHDIGKIGVPDAILLKPGRLTPEERAEMQRHAVIGADLLAGSSSDVLRMGEQIALGHHERWDGAGYPHERTRSDIPLVARIVAVADVFDALTNERPYKEAWPIERAVALIEREAGAQFDPEVVAAFAGLDHAALLSDTAASQHVTR